MYSSNGKWKLIFPTAFGWDMLVPRRCFRRKVMEDIGRFYGLEGYHQV